MKRILPLPLLLVIVTGAANGCKSTSNGDDTPNGPQTREQDPNQPGSSGGGPGVTQEELNTNPIEGVEPPTVVHEAGAFTDGPVWHAQMGVLFFSTPLGEGGLFRMLPDGRGMRIREGNREQGTTPVGNTVNAAGDLITVEMKRIVRATAAGEDVEVIATGWKPGGEAPPPADGGAPAPREGAFDTLNDVVARSDGTLYVTDPGYYAEPEANRLYRIDPAKNVEVVEAFADVPRPNGIALSPDEKTLYVGFSAPQEGTMPFIRKYIVNDDGTVGEWTKFKDIPPADSEPDGLAVDRAGNVYVATKAGIEVYRPNGQQWGTLAVPEQPTGMTFGGDDMKTLYITTQGTRIYQAHLKVAGLSQ